MDTQQILDMLLKSGQELAAKGASLAEAKLNLPDDPAQRQALLDGAGKGAMAASALALLLGTSAGRKLTGASIKLGSLAAIGTVAYNAFQSWQSQQGQATTAAPAIAPPQANTANGQALLAAMIAAAKADGHIDEQERTLIAQQVEKLGLGAAAGDLLMAELNKPLDIKAVAAGATSPESAAEIYLVSRAVVDTSNPQEQDYLKQLAEALGLAPELVAQLESHAAA